ncbi:hypothetical protein ACWGJ2_30540 [Streptomyces sp. NPDC054796]
MEQSSATSPLAGAVLDLASEVVSALRGGDHSSVVRTTAGIGENDDVGIAAVRVLGADVLLPSTMLRLPPQQDDLAVFQQAVRAFPPGADASAATAWSHWAMRRTLRSLDGAVSAGLPSAPVRADTAAHDAMDASDEPDASWLRDTPWQQLTHHLAVLSALAVPSVDSGVARAAGERPVDVARGFVRAVRRRDWLQAAGAGRWLAVLDGVPATLGLDSGLEFVLHMGGTDPRVALHVQAAQLMRGGDRS